LGGGENEHPESAVIVSANSPPVANSLVVSKHPSQQEVVERQEIARSEIDAKDHSTLGVSFEGSMSLK
jgi:hypothetical protein